MWAHLPFLEHRLFPDYFTISPRDFCSSLRQTEGQTESDS